MSAHTCAVSSNKVPVPTVDMPREQRLRRGSATALGKEGAINNIYSFAIVAGFVLGRVKLTFSSDHTRTGYCQAHLLVRR